MTEVTYRRSDENDAEVVFGLTARAVSTLAPAYYSAEIVCSWMAGRTPEGYRNTCAAGEMIIAEVGKAPAGFGHAVPGEVVRLFVDVKFAGLGIGAELMGRVLLDALPTGAGLVKISATLNAAPFYEKWGFKRVGSSKYSGRGPELPQIELVEMEQTFTKPPC